MWDSGRFGVKLKQDSTGWLEHLAAKLLKDTDWPDDIKTALTLPSSVAPRIYGLLKIHNDGCPLTYHLSEYLVGLLKPLLGKIKAHVCNSGAMVEMLGSLVLGSTDRVVSLAVVSHFTRVLLKAT